MAVFGSLGRVKSKALDLLGMKQLEQPQLHGNPTVAECEQLAFGPSWQSTDGNASDAASDLMEEMDVTDSIRSGPPSPIQISSKAMDILGINAPPPSPRTARRQSLAMEQLLKLEELMREMDDEAFDSQKRQEAQDAFDNFAASEFYKFPTEEYTCRYCSIKIEGLELLRRHLYTTHRKQTHLVCPEGCNNKIWTSEGFEWHMKIMHDKTADARRNSGENVLPQQVSGEELLEVLVNPEESDHVCRSEHGEGECSWHSGPSESAIIDNIYPDLSLLLNGVEPAAAAMSPEAENIFANSPAPESPDRLNQSENEIRALKALREELEQKYFDYNHVLKIAPSRTEFHGLISALIGENNCILRYLGGLDQAIAQAKEVEDRLSGVGPNGELASEDNGLPQLDGYMNFLIGSEGGGGISSGSDEDLRLDGLRLQQRFKRASMTAYDKLLRSAPSQSPAFQDFVASIGDHDTLLQRGIQCLTLFLSHETTSLSILDVYSFLHVAYAISQTETDNPAKSTPVEFRCGIDTFRSFLDDMKPTDDSPSERELFDEIVDVMWNELEYAVAWIGKQKNWNWDFMAETSSKAQKLQVARDLLKAGAENDGDSIFNVDMSEPSSADVPPEPSFVREVREWGERYGEDIVEIDVRHYRQLQTARQNRTSPMSGISRWLDIVTSSIFFIVLGFLQAIQNTNEDFDYVPEAPYSCLLHPTPESDKCLLPQYRDYMAQIRKNVFTPTLKHYVADPLSDMQFVKLLSTALELVKTGVIGTIRDFENYVLGLRKLYNRSTDQDTLFVANILSNCWTCSSAIKENMPYRITSSRQPEYGPEYVAQRMDEEYEQQDNAEDEDETMQDADHEVVSEHSPVANSSAPSTPVSRVFETPSPRSSTGTDASTVSPSYSKPDSPPRVKQHRRRRSSQKEPPQPLVCSEEGCTRTFSSQSNLNRHRISFHGGSGGFLCGVDGCDVRFTRKDNVYKHRDVVHGVRRKPKRKQLRE